MCIEKQKKNVITDVNHILKVNVLPLKIDYYKMIDNESAFNWFQSFP